MNHPTLCRPEAFFYFKKQLPILESTTGLVRASVAIAMHAREDLETPRVERQLAELGDRVSRRVRSRQTSAVLAHLHDVLFEEEGFRGNTEDYYNPLNSYLPAVLELRTGIPITLSLVYKAVAETLGLRVEGVNAPGHFVMRVMTDEGWMIIDPFFGGGVLTEEEAFERMEQVTGRPVPRAGRYLSPASHSQWLSRMLTNLQHVFATRDRRHDLVAMNELQSLLDSSAG
jgi:regulator of sirC expression with transglutaminase-like and TPR domain